MTWQVLKKRFKLSLHRLFILSLVIILCTRVLERTVSCDKRAAYDQLNDANIDGAALTRHLFVHA